MSLKDKLAAAILALGMSCQDPKEKEKSPEIILPPERDDHYYESLYQAPSGSSLIDTIQESTFGDPTIPPQNINPCTAIEGYGNIQQKVSNQLDVQEIIKDRVLMKKEIKSEDFQEKSSLFEMKPNVSPVIVRSLEDRLGNIKNISNGVLPANMSNYLKVISEDLANDSLLDSIRKGVNEYSPKQDNISHAERLEKARYAYESGMEMSDEEFDLNEHLPNLEGFIELSYQAARDWNEARFEPAKDTLMKSIARDADLSYKAIVNLPRERTQDHLKMLVQSVVSSPYLCAKAGKDWDDDLFEDLKHRLVNRIVSEGSSSYQAITQWPLTRLEEFATPLVQIVSSNLENIVKIGTKLDKERFELVAPKTIKKLEFFPEAAYAALIHWTDEKVENYFDELASGIAGTKYALQALVELPDHRYHKVKDKLLTSLYETEFLVQAGIELSDTRFEEVKDTLVEMILEDGTEEPAVKAFEAGRDWSPERYVPYAKRFLDRISGDRQLVIAAYGEWPNTTFDEVADQFADTLSQYTKFVQTMGDARFHKNFFRLHKVKERLIDDVKSKPQVCYQIGASWSADNLRGVIHKLAPGLSPSFSLQALSAWPTELESEFEEALLDNIATDPEFCYHEGLRRINQRSGPTSPEFTLFLEVSLKHRPDEVLKTWRLNRTHLIADKNRKIYLQAFGVPEAEEVYSQLAHKSKDLWIEILLRTKSPKEFGSLSSGVFNQIERVYGIAEYQLRTEAFYANLTKSLRNGTVDKWTQTIIDHFDKAAIGGGNYRVLGRAI